MSDIREDIIRLGEQLASERDAAYDLWTWLPSHTIAKQHHGDYTDEQMPSVRDIMVEAAIFIGQKCAPTSDQLVQGDFYQCPCEEHHWPSHAKLGD